MTTRFRRIRTVLAVCSAGVAAASCAERSAPGSWAGSVTDSAGVVMVANPSVGLWAEGGAWRLEEELRIGEFAGRPEYQFAQVGSIALNSAGEILVMDRQIRTLRVFSHAGEFVRSVGSPGAGPGEFGLGVTDVFVATGDTILIPDLRNQRVHRFAPDGALVDSSPIDVARWRPLRFRWNQASGRAVVQLRSTELMREGGGRPDDELRLLERDGAIGEKLLSFPPGGLLGPGTVRAFTPEPMWDVTDSLSVLYGVNSDYRIGTYARDGSLRRVISRAHEPRPITDRDIRAFFAYLDRAWLAAGVPPSSLETNHQRYGFAETFPAYSTFLVGREGSLWVQPVRAPGDMTDEEVERYNFIEDFGTSEWDVFDRDGLYLGQVVMPPRFQPRLFMGDLIYGVTRDEFDVQYIVRVRVLTEAEPSHPRP